MGSNVVKQITNNDKIDPNYPEIDKPLRAKQSSNLEKINEIKKRGAFLIQKKQ